PVLHPSPLSLAPYRRSVFLSRARLPARRRHCFAIARHRLGERRAALDLVRGCSGGPCHRRPHAPSAATLAALVASTHCLAVVFVDTMRSCRASSSARAPTTPALATSSTTAPTPCPSTLASPWAAPSREGPQRIYCCLFGRTHEKQLGSLKIWVLMAAGALFCFSVNVNPSSVTDKCPSSQTPKPPCCFNCYANAALSYCLLTNSCHVTKPTSWSNAKISYISNSIM
ncbi:unnamed protein product, partial [Urochloa humidicola]